VRISPGTIAEALSGGVGVYRSTWRRIAVGCLLLGTLLVAGPADAATKSPRLRSMSAPSPQQAGPGVPVQIDFSASEPRSGAGISEVAFLFKPVQDGPYILLTWYRPRNHATTVSATARGSVNPRSPAGRYSLVQVRVADRGGPSTYYYPDRVQSYGYSPPPPETDVDWSQFVDVVNPAGDSEPPHLTSVKVWRPNVRAGQPVVLLYRTAADAGDVAQVVFSYTSPKDGPFDTFAVFQDVPGLAAVGPAVRVIPRAGYGGVYRAYAVSITDVAGNTTTYERDDSGQSGDGIDLSAADFTVAPYAEDSTAPRLSSVSLRSSHKPLQRDQLAIDYRATDNATGVAGVDALWDAGHEHHLEVIKSCHSPATGPAASVIPDWAVGKFRLQRLDVADRMGNVSSYHRDGRVTHSPAGASAATHHHFDLTRLDFTVQDALGGTMVAPRFAGLFCILDSIVEIVSDAKEVLPGRTVTLSSRVTSHDKPVRYPYGAVYQKDRDGNIKLLGIARGGRDGHIVTQVTPLRSSKYWTWYFGVEHNRVISEGTSPATEVKVLGS
jgi:hypothetical protein